MLTSKTQAVRIDNLPEFVVEGSEIEMSRREKIHEMRRNGVLSLPVEVIEKPEQDSEAFVRQVTSSTYVVLLNTFLD